MILLDVINWTRTVLFLLQKLRASACLCLVSCSLLYFCCQFLSAPVFSAHIFGLNFRNVRKHFKLPRLCTWRHSLCLKLDEDTLLALQCHYGPIAWTGQVYDDVFYNENLGEQWWLSSSALTSVGHAPDCSNGTCLVFMGELRSSPHHHGSGGFKWRIPRCNVQWPDMYITLQNPSFEVSLWSTEFAIELRKILNGQKVTLIVLVLHWNWILEERKL